MLRIKKRAVRPVVYFRLDVPADGPRSNAYHWESDRTFRFGDAVTNVPGWGRVVVVDDPVTRGVVDYVPVAEAGWASRAVDEALAKRRGNRSRR
jgi:hypothetical protein